jgi:hypothetical protein
LTVTIGSFAYFSIMHTPDAANLQFQLAADFVSYTNSNVFLTGRAGTGKTTFLKYIRSQTPKHTVVVAPTGVAAINAGGVTIHSFFNLPFGPFLPGTVSESFVADGDENGQVNDKHSLLARLRYNREKRNILRSLELLIIDEVSMVRSDMLDAIDLILRSFRSNHQQPFGGVQVLFIGDMHQLPPVVKDDEWQLLQQYYSSPFFFDSLVLKENPPTYVELEKIYRQNEQQFIDLLNQVRNNNLDEKGRQLLHTRYLPQFQPKKSDGYITLTSHNYKADSINSGELQKLPGQLYEFKAEVKGEFSEKSYPAEETLKLKAGAQVMFIKNDVEKGRRYFNGKLGVIIEISDELIVVQANDDGQKIKVSKEVWKNVRYSIDSKSQQLKEDELGSFTQYPLRLAWAITIHKSQGLTFQKLIIDAGDSFAAGQVYVALSRCTSLEGLVLHSRINPNSVFTDTRINRFGNSKPTTELLQPQLQEAKHHYQGMLLKGLFELKPILKAVEGLQKVVDEHQRSFNAEAVPYVKELSEKVTALQQVADKFQIQLKMFLSHPQLPVENEALQERIKKAAAYFATQLLELSLVVKDKSPTISDSRENAEEYNEALQQVYTETVLLQRLMDACKNGFELNHFLRTRAKNLIAQITGSAYAGAVLAKANNDNHPHIDLMHKLRRLRDDLCRPDNKPIYLVAGSTTLNDLARYLPQTKEELAKIVGFGPTKVRQYGKAFLTVIKDYCEENNLQSDMGSMTAKRTRKPKVEGLEKMPSKEVTFQKFKEGKTIVQIAAERNMTVGTIESHLAEYVNAGELEIEALLDAEKIEMIALALSEANGDTLTPVKEALGEKATYGEIRLVKNWMKKRLEAN